MADDIKLVVGVDYSELTGLVKTSQQTKRVLSSAAKEFARTGSQKQYMHAVNKIVLAQKQLDVSSRMTRSEIMKLGAKMQQEVKFTDALTASTKRLTVAQMSSSKGMQQTKRSTNQLGVMMQQTGYQVGDFAVQVGSGQNVMVAFGQQATQLVGTMAMFSKTTKMIALFSGLGIAIPVITGIGAAFMRTRGAVEEVVDVFEGASSALDNMSSSASNAQRPLSDLADRFGEGANQAKLLLGVISAIEKTRFKIAFSGAADSLKGLFDVGDFTSEGLRTLTVAGAAQKTILDRLLKQQRDFLSEGDALSANKLGNQITDARLSFNTAFGAMNSNVLALAERLKVLPAVATEFAAVLASVGEAKTFDEKGKAAVELSNFIRDNVNVTNELSEAENEALLTALELSLQFLESENNLSGTVDKANGLASALREAASAMSSLAGFSDSLDKKLAVSLAKVQALNAGANSAVAGSVAALRFDLSRKVEDAKTSGVDAGIVDRMYGGLRSQISSFETSETERKRLEEANKPSSGGGSGKDFSQNEYLSGLHDEAKFKHTLVRLSAEQVTEAERRRQIIMKIQSEGKVADEDRIKTILRTEAATRSAIEAEEQRQSTMDMITGNIESAFMSMVDGSKSVEDAFKGMLRNIILAIYQEQVAKPFATAIGNAIFGSANGNVFSGGSHVKAYANGGVVNGPTTFPMNGGKTGLMGEAGPEAIMPLKRGSNGKLGVQMEGGGGDTINVVQNFNFQANGDDTVKKLIAQAAPKIAQMTKSSLLDDRRRGGSTKAAFG